MSQYQDPRFAQTKYIVEATNYEKYALWVENNAREKVTWVQGSGIGPVIGTVEGKPVSVSVLWDTVDGQLVMFYHPISRMVDHDMVDKWLAEQCPHLFPKGSVPLMTDADSFVHCLQHLRALRKASINA